MTVGNYVRNLLGLGAAVVCGYCGRAPAPRPGPPGRHALRRPPDRWPVGVLRHAKRSVGVSPACRTLAWRNSPPPRGLATLVRTLSGAWPGFSRLGPTLRARTLALDYACKPLDAHVNR